MDQVKNPFSVSMPIILVIMAAIILTATAAYVEADPVPLPRDCHLNQVRENPRNPRSFYWCLSDGPVLMKCVDALVFDIDAGKCISKKEHERRRQNRRGDKLVNFQERKNKLNFGVHAMTNGEYTSSPSLSKISSKAVPECTVPDPKSTSIYFPGPDCHHFYQCDNGIPKVIECPANLEWNPNLETCDWKESAGCTPPSPPTTEVEFHFHPGGGFIPPPKKNQRPPSEHSL